MSEGGFTFSFDSSATPAATDESSGFSFNFSAPVEEKKEDAPVAEAEEEAVPGEATETTVIVGGQEVTLKPVEIKTMEEEEEIVFEERARMYRFNKDAQEWKERGRGLLKFLTHKQHKKTRILMRRDKTLKICGNHYITSPMSLTPHNGSDKAFVYVCHAEFSDGELKEELLAVRFASAEITKEFEKQFNEARERNDALLAADGQEKPVEQEVDLGDDDE